MLIEKKDYSRYGIALIPSTILTVINYQMTKVFMNSTVIDLTLKGKTKNLIEVYPIFIKTVRFIYHPIIFSAVFIMALVAINFVMIQKPKKEKIEEPKLYPDTIPYNQVKDKFELHLGVIHNDRDLEITPNPKVCTIENKNIFKNFVVFGVIGEGKTASALLPLVQQAVYYYAHDAMKKIGGFVTDVKGNFSKYVVDYLKDVGRDDDVILFRVCGDYYYNFIYKPDEPAPVLASRLVEYLKGHNQSGNESYWIDSAQKALENGIKLARLSNKDEYITFEDLDRVVVDDEERALVIENLQQKYEAGKMTKYERELFESAKTFFEKKYDVLSGNVKSIIVSEVDRVVGAFTSDPLIKHTFCPPKEKLNFPGFRQIIEEGKWFIFDIPNERFKGVAEMACAFAKLDYQSMILQRMSNREYNQDREACYVSDENHKIATPNDPDYYSLAREAKNFSIVATQSISSYLTVLKNENLVNNMLNNLDNKIFMRNTDPKTLDYALKVLGKEVKTYQNRSTSESGKSDIDYLASNIAQDNKSISQSVSEVDRKEEIFTQEFFSRILDEFKAVALVNSGKVLAPIHLFKYWENLVTKDYPIKKATVKKEFIYTDYPTTDEMIAKVNGSDIFKVVEEEPAQDQREQQSMFIVNDKEKEELDNKKNKQVAIEEPKAEKQITMNELEQQNKTEDNKEQPKKVEAKEKETKKEHDKEDSLLDTLL